jgi:23S rRNA (adenine2503-C2)-methyltransferase
MKILAKTEKEGIATVYIAEMDNGKLIEFAESVQPPLPREKKWVLTLSTLYGCPISCKFCDAGSRYQGKLSAKDLFSQIDYLICRHFENGKVPVQKFKVQFARMGEPALNPNVLDVLEQLPIRYDAPGLLPSLSTIAPKGTEGFFERLLRIKRSVYGEHFQLQFSIHTTDIEKRDWLMPTKKWDFERLAEYGEEFFHDGGRKISLNFALVDGMPVCPEVLLRHFVPTKFLVKITPVNPTFQANRNGLASHVSSNRNDYEIVEKLKEADYEVILSIGELAENDIGSNCGQHITNFLRAGKSISDGYTVPLKYLGDQELAAIC